VYDRNVLVQKGSLFDFPTAKNPEDRRFRLIDFGRTTEMTGGKNCTIRVTGECQCSAGAHKRTQKDQWDEDQNEAMQERMKAQMLFKLADW